MAKRKLDIQYEEQSEINDIGEENSYKLRSELKQLMAQVES